MNTGTNYTLHTERKKSYFDIVLEECCIIEQVD